jgi:hypothetical protein
MMGYRITGQCGCGFTGHAFVASGRAGHGKVFSCPHYCDDCNSLISVDMIGVNILKQPYNCEKCGSENIGSYAVKTKRISTKVISTKKNSTFSFINKLPSFVRSYLFRKGYYSTNINSLNCFEQTSEYHKEEAELCHSNCHINKKSFTFLKDNQYCPQCKKYEMSFFVSLYFD